jgi:hypothetical protein
MAPLQAQLAVTARVQVENNKTDRASGFPTVQVYTTFLMALDSRAASQVLEVKSYVRDGVVRVEGLAPLMGWPPHLVLLVLADGDQVWLDAVKRTYHAAATMPAIPLTPKVQSKADGKANLLGRTAPATRTDIDVTIPEQMPQPGISWHEYLLRQAFAERPVVTTAKPGTSASNQTVQTVDPAQVALSEQEAWARDYDASAQPRSNERSRISVRTWTTSEFGDEGLLVAKTGVTAALDRNLRLAPAGMTLRQVVTASSGRQIQHWETTVTSIGTHALPAEAFQVPATFSRGELLRTLGWGGVHFRQR